ncbi:glycosyltransferase family 4 protein [Paenarthrobacter sp. NEAU-H11]|uniref:glycosyltransferase family 4 protein n=1 Tax=Paenarthrobacter sp. NEAU-H11 TaxID=3423924 RepID=UPI003D337B98
MTIIGLHYAPESSGNAPYTTRLAERLVAGGHNVQVLTGYPHYPEWKLAEGYKGWTRREDINGVAVKRLRHFIPSRVTTLSRLHMELSFGFRLFTSSWGRPDVVVVVSPALFSSAFALLRRYAGVSRPGIGLWMQDLYSRGLEETGGGSSLASRMVKRLEGALARSATKTTVIHQRFADYLCSNLNVPADDVSVIRNWSHVEQSGDVDTESVRARFGWSENDLVVLHAGNMGIKQALQNVVAAARLAESRGSRVRFVLLGDGNQRPFLEELAQSCRNVQFISPLSDRDFMPVLMAADILLVNEMEGLREMSVPSKLTSYFRTGRPIIAATEADSATAGEISDSGGGIVVNPGDPAELLVTAERLGIDKDLGLALGRAGRKFADHMLAESAAIVQYENWLQTIAAANDAKRKIRSKTSS